MPFTVLTDTSERLRQYRDALDFYLRETTLPIVFCENTLCDFSDDYKDYINKGRLEYITFDGNNFDKTKGKGYGEAIIMEEAFRKSVIIEPSDIIVKITGRLKVLNINVLINDNIRLFANTIQTMNPSNDYVDSRVIVSPLSFFIDSFLTKKHLINDNNNSFFEHVLFKSLVQRKNFMFIPFLHIPEILGMSGSNGNEYKPENRNINITKYMFDMFGNTVRIERQCEYYRIPLLIKGLIVVIRCLLLLRIKLEHPF
ncbi:MAG: hypothetical protein ACI4D4_03900 [Lachnospira sp.]